MPLDNILPAMVIITLEHSLPGTGTTTLCKTITRLLAMPKADDTANVKR